MSRITLESANRIIAAAFAAGAAMKAKPIAVAVLNADGHIISLQRQDGASMFRNDVAMGKAWGAVAMGESSRSLARKAKANPNFVSALAVTSGGRLLPNPGGVLVKNKQGEVIGAVGISGDSGDNDESLGIAGIEEAGLIADAGQVE